MNTNGISNQRGCVGKSVIVLLWVASAITVIIPLLTIVFDANKTDLNRDLEGVLVREMRIAENRPVPKVNLSRHQLKFGEVSKADKDETGDQHLQNLLKKKSAMVWQRIAEEIPGMISDKDFTLPVSDSIFSPSEFSNADLDQLAQQSEVNTMALTLPAARRSYVTKVIPDEFPVSLVQETRAEVYSFEECEEFELLPAKDFVESLIPQAFSDIEKPE